MGWRKVTYQIWAFTTAGVKSAYLENALDISLTKEANAAPTLSFSLPADDAKTTFLTTAYEVKIWNTLKSRFEGLYTLEDATDQWTASGKVIACNYAGAMVQLVDEENISYDTTATPKTPTAIVTALLALQTRTPAITVGTIQPTTTFCIAVENVNLLKAFQQCVSYLGGYIEVDEDRHFNWYNEPSTTTPTREIRYAKNMEGVTRKRDFTSITNKLYAYGYGEKEVQLNLIDAGETYEYIENAASQLAYGVHPRRITDKRITHPSTLLKWAQKVLAEYKDPVYSYTVDAVNLAEHPDFSFDYESFEIGQIVRVVNSDLIDPITGLGLNVNVKIVKVTTNLSKPEEISLELANATKSLADLIANTAETASLVNNVAVQISAGQVEILGGVKISGWASAGVTTINGGQITANTITADAIKTSTLNAKTITLGTTGGDSIIKSGNYVADTSGWQIKANGDAEFNSVKIRGTLYTTSIASGSVLTINGAVKSTTYTAGSAGWQINGDGSAEFSNVIVRGTIATCTISSGSILTVEGTIQTPSYSPGDTGWQITGAGGANFKDIVAYGYIRAGSAYIYSPKMNLYGGDGTYSYLYSPNGDDLSWVDSSGHVHVIYDHP
jgi:phage minor structural protein